MGAEDKRKKSGASRAGLLFMAYLTLGSGVKGLLPLVSQNDPTASGPDITKTYVDTKADVRVATPKPVSPTPTRRPSSTPVSSDKSSSSEKNTHVRTFHWESYSFVGKPTVSQSVFKKILQNAGSPAAKHADEMYTIILKKGIDPALILAIYGNESGYGTAKNDITQKTANVCNMRPWDKSMPVYKGFVNFKAKYGDRAYVYATDACSNMIRAYYDKRGIKTITPLINILTPPSENNTTGYISGVRKKMEYYNKLSL